MLLRMRSILMALAVVALACLGPTILAQTIDGNLTGTVVDPTGATVPNATVEITNPATGIKSTTRTAVDGLYRFNNIPVGNYDVTCRRPDSR
jgi:protocatechuate 3,4-dioxygenase beta subunit